MGLVTSVANQKGGVGKTTTAINLAAALAAGRRGARVMLVEDGPECHVPGSYLPPQRRFAGAPAEPPPINAEPPVTH